VYFCEKGRAKTLIGCVPRQQKIDKRDKLDAKDHARAKKEFFG